MKKFTLSFFLSIGLLVFTLPAFDAVARFGDPNNDHKADMADAALTPQATGPYVQPSSA